jgi:hypothetical protein
VLGNSIERVVMHETVETWWTVFTDPNHVIAELMWTLIQDGFIGFFLYGIVWKKMVLPKLHRDIHEEIDKEHSITHDDLDSREPK